MGTQNVAAAYAEIDVPVIKQLDIDAAIRYDHYNLSGGQASPKIGFKFSPIPEFSLRGTASKGFRAPGPAENGKAGQTFFAGSEADPVLCPHPEAFTAAGNFAGQCNVSVPGLQGTNPDLKPETSKSFTFGLIGQPTPDVTATVDIYSVQINNQIVAGGPSITVRGTNLSPIAQYQADGSTALVAPPQAPILYFTTSYINANSTKTNGLDVSLDYRHRFDAGWQFKSSATWTYIHEFKMTIDGVDYQLAGTDYAGVLASGVIPPQTSCTVKHFTTVDVYGSYDLSKHFNVHASVTNLFNTKAPLDWATYGGALGAVPWNPSLHLQGAIGTFFTLGATYKF